MKVLQNMHIVQAWPPHDINGNAASDLALLNAADGSRAVSLKHYDHVAVIINFGAIAQSGIDADITCYACSTIAGANAVAMSDYTIRQTAAFVTDASGLTPGLWSSDISITDSDIDLADESDIDYIHDGSDLCVNNGMVCIEFNACDVLNATSDTVDRDCFYVTISDPGDSLICGGIYILTSPAYAGFYMASATAD